MQHTVRPSVRWWPFAIAVPLTIAVFLVVKHSSTRGGVPLRLVELVIAAIAICVIWVVPASWSICAGLFLSMFDGNWQNFLGLPHSVAPDRIVLVLALLAICVRAPGASN